MCLILDAKFGDDPLLQKHGIKDCEIKCQVMTYVS